MPSRRGGSRGTGAGRGDAFTLGVLLAGGAASRMGGWPKGLLPLAPGRRVLDGPLDALRAVAGTTVIATNARLAPVLDLGHEVVLDETPGLGALGALHTALLHGVERLALTVVTCPWDLPFVTAALLQAMVSVLEAGDADAVVPFHGGEPEPLCAAWRPHVALDRCEALLASGERSARALLEGLQVVRFDEAAIRAVGDPATLFLNVNTARDLEAAAGRLAER